MQYRPMIYCVSTCVYGEHWITVSQIWITYLGCCCSSRFSLSQSWFSTCTRSWLWTWACRLVSRIHSLSFSILILYLRRELIAQRGPWLPEKCIRVGMKCCCGKKEEVRGYMKTGDQLMLTVAIKQWDRYLTLKKKRFAAERVSFFAEREPCLKSSDALKV